MRSERRERAAAPLLPALAPRRRAQRRDPALPQARREQLAIARAREQRRELGLVGCDERGDLVRVQQRERVGTPLAAQRGARIAEIGDPAARAQRAQQERDGATRRGCRPPGQGLAAAARADAALGPAAPGARTRG